MDGRRAAATLGVGPRATKHEIRQAFRARAKVLHPDAGDAGSMERFIGLRQAFERLMADTPASRPSSATFETAKRTDRPRPATIDLSDTIRRRPPRSSAPRPAPGAARREQRRDARGLSFADHLSAALARP